MKKTVFNQPTNQPTMKKPKKLLSKGSTNAKLAKNANFGHSESYILYLSPYNQNSKGINVCPHASPACAAACLNTAGRGAFNSVQKARREKTDYFLTDRNSFLHQLYCELVKINKKAGKTFKRIPVRLNGTSDLDFHKLFASLGWNIFALENLIFYDYTKVYNRLKKYDGQPYHLTFSRSEVNEAETVEALKNGYNVAVVFKNSLPETWNGFPVVDGDLSDLRFMDPSNVVVGLKAKGKAKKETTGFTVNS